MKKRMLAFLSMLVLLSCGLTVAVSADASTDRYRVGYEIRDINPYIYSDSLGFGVKDVGELANDSDWTVPVDVQNPETNATTTERMIRVPLSGYGNSTSRFSNSIMDDNGDGYVGTGDGLHITCTTVTDSEGTTLVIYTLDALSGYDGVVNSVSQALWTALEGAVKPQDIFVNGSHTHEGPDFGSVKKTINEDSSNRDRLWRAYFDYVVQQMVDAAVECYKGRSEAIMTKGTIDASDATGYQLNFVRNYKVNEYPKVSGGGYSSTPNYSYVFGSNFGESRQPVEAAALKRTVEHVSEADDKMHILQFSPTNGDQPIILANWRCHATLMSSYTGGGSGDTISADYIAGFRYAMQQKGYRVAFLQGAGGNIVSSSAIGDKSMDSNPGLTGYWVNDVTGGNNAIYYGAVKLADVAMKCLSNNGNMSGELTAGPIRSTCQTLDLQMQKDSPGLIAAAENYKTTGELKFTYPEDGKVYILNSSHHATQVLARATANPDFYEDLTVNAFTLGEYVTFVTSPTEMFDRYSDTATLDDTTDNDWDDLKSATYGTPFVMAYTNGAHNYTANRLSYSYNIGSEKFGVGGYEANSTRTVAGEGERMIREYKRMINSLEAPLDSDYCPQCEREVQWEPLCAPALRKGATLTNGHYRLVENVPLSAFHNYITIQGKVCLDLNGCTFESRGRALVLSSKDAALSILDSSEGQAGKMIGYNALGAYSGGVVEISQYATLNLYSGTLKMDTDPNKGQTPPDGHTSIVTKGGVINATGNVNIYGGCIDASACVMAQDFNNMIGGSSDGCGAAICLTRGDLKIYGGKIIAGRAESNSGKGDCIYAQTDGSNITIGGDAQIDEIYFRTTPKLTIDNAFSGSVAIHYPEAYIAEGKDVGNIKDTDLSAATVICKNKPDAGFYADGTDLRLSLPETGTAAVVEGSKGKRFFGDFESAMAFYNDGLITLKKNVNGAVNVTRNTNLDLAGFDVTGKVTVASGCTLYGMDSKTDDFTVADGNFGKLTDVSGNVAGLPLEATCAQDGYLMIQEDGARSFHRVNLRIHTMTLRAEVSPGLYYKCDFEGDEMVEEKVAQFGVALGLSRDLAEATTLDGQFLYSEFYDFESGASGNINNPSTLLSGVFKTTNLPLINARNANLPVYGRAYLLLEDGTCVFGRTVSRSLRQQVECVDDRWSSLDNAQKEVVVQMCSGYLEVVKDWEIPNIMEAIRLAGN